MPLLYARVAHSGACTCVAWSPDERQVVTGGNDCCVCIYNLFSDEGDVQITDANSDMEEDASHSIADRSRKSSHGASSRADDAVASSHQRGDRPKGRPPIPPLRRKDIRSEEEDLRMKAPDA